ncbi:Hypothetical protein PHPALM_16783 [Phytophthora palmivora]|uniref:Uncharacterized protein n=1 Tax=Phytophthora palmivora TaxID=4796 RepID=A0A2P4XNY9_9STRA|nr:Hypothetical protein PHPALM_16783 [Phytophthora palmivora]
MTAMTGTAIKHFQKSKGADANNGMGTELRSAKPLDGFNCYFIKLSELMSEKRQLAGNWI